MTKKEPRPVMELEKFRKALNNPYLLHAAPSLESVTPEQLLSLWHAVMVNPTPEPLSKEAIFAIWVAIGAGVVVDKLTEGMSR